MSYFAKKFNFKIQNEMKKTIIMLLALLGMTQALAQDYEYVPFVREGVKWVCYYDNPTHVTESPDFDGHFIPYGMHYYTLELKGDTIINGKSYKPLHLYSGQDINEDCDSVPVYLREENKVVYGIIPDDTRYFECPIGVGTLVFDCRLIDRIETGVEFILYDFNDLVSFYDQHDDEWISTWSRIRSDYSIYTDTVLLGNHLRKRLVIHGPLRPRDEYIIEGIGFASNIMDGNPFDYFYDKITGFTQVLYGLSHVIEDGEIIYKSPYCDPSVGIDEVVADGARRPLDANYYNLMGQPVGHDVPTTPGIYIHQGKKIVVR